MVISIDVDRGGKGALLHDYWLSLDFDSVNKQIHRSIIIDFSHLFLQVLDDGLNIDVLLGGCAGNEALGRLGHLQCTSTRSFLEDVR